MDHLRALRDVSEIDNGDSGKVVHEVVTDGTVYFGANADAGNTDETAKFPSCGGAAVALDRRRPLPRRALRPSPGAGCATVWATLDADGDGWPEGLGNVEREGMGEEKLDVSVYAIRGLFDLADLARSKGDRATARWAAQRGRSMLAAFEGAWWMPEVPQHADSLRAPGQREGPAAPLDRRDADGGRAGDARRAAARPDHPRPRQRGARPARDGLLRRRLRALPHRPGGLRRRRPHASSEEQAFTLNTAVMAVGEGNYGRLGAQQQRRFTAANRRLQLPDFDEQPGAMPEIAPSPLNGRTIDRSFLERPMVLQAWGAYGTAWPVVHQHLGVRPDLGRGRLEVTPQLPPYEQRIAGANIRLGRGAIDVVAASRGGRHRTVVHSGLALRRLTLGHTLPFGTRVRAVWLDGRRVRRPLLRRTNRGLEVLARVKGPARGRHVLVVR